MNNFNIAINSTPVVLVEFFATWCPHCQRMMPIVADIRDQLEKQINVFQYDIDKNEELSTTNQIETVPTFIIFRDGKEVWRYSGEIGKDVLLNKLHGAAKGICATSYS